MDISVVIPTHNRVEYLRTILPSYLAAREVSKIIVVDDASIDETCETIRKIQMDFPCIEYHKFPQNKGSAYARNFGLHQVQTPLVFMTDDDIYIDDPDYFSKLVSWMDTTQADVISNRVILMKDKENYTEARQRVNQSYAMKPYVKAGIELNKQHNTQDCLLTYILPEVMLMNIAVVENDSYDPDYRVNGWREETDFQLALHSHGKRLVFCPFLSVYHLPPKKHNLGGNRSGKRIRYEYWVIRNNLRFAIKNRERLRSIGLHFSLLMAIYWTIHRWWILIHARFFNP